MKITFMLYLYMIPIPDCYRQLAMVDPKGGYTHEPGTGDMWMPVCGDRMDMPVGDWMYTR